MELVLLTSVLLPLIGAGMIWGMAQAERRVVRNLALATTLITLVLAVTVIAAHDPTAKVPTATADSSAPQARLPGEFAVFSVPWLKAESAGIDLNFSLGLDGLSIWLYGLTALLMVTAVLVSWQAIQERASGFYALLLVLEAGMLGVFTARDIILFYVFFEFTLIPLFFLIGVWGSEDRQYAAKKFFLFTFAGSVITFLGLLAIVLWNAGAIGAASNLDEGGPRPLTFSIPELTRDLSAEPGDVLSRRDRALFTRLDADGDDVLTMAELGGDPSSLVALSENYATDSPERIFWRLDANEDGQVAAREFRRADAGLQTWIFLALFVGFAVKVPLFPLHTWLPLAHVQAPTAGSVLLAGVLLKIGTYGFVRFSLPLLPLASAEAAPWVLWLSVIGIIYGALVALAQGDIKRLIAYSSVSHLGFCMVGLFALNNLGLQGGVLQMINHGLATGGLFCIVGMLYERYHTRRIADLGGLAKRAPVLAFFMLVFTFSSIGLPGLNGFAGEFLLLTGMFDRAATTPGALGTELMWIAVMAVSGVVLGAWYMLWLVQRVFFGPLKEPRQIHDELISPRGGTGEEDELDGDPHDEPIRDLSRREVFALVPLVAFIVWIGVQPKFFLDRMAPTLDPIAGQVNAAVTESIRSGSN